MCKLPVHFVALAVFLAVVSACGKQGATTKSAQQASEQLGVILPFPATPTASIAKRRLQDSEQHARVDPDRLPKDAPNVLIIMIDDCGFGTPSTFGGFAQTPNLSKLSTQGISYNRFHTTSICSPTRACLLTGRNHQRVGSGTIAERAVDWDGYTGIIPKSAATLAEVLRQYGYKTSAFGKWHNTPADQTTAMGPFDFWPTGYGFDYFYGFLAGETSQWEPRLVENTTQIEPPHGPHFTELMADRAISWLSQHRAYSPDKPFFMYWAPGGVHGPHQVATEWSDKYKGKFDQGWDTLRGEIFERQKKLKWIPAETRLTERAKSMASWESIPESQRAFQSRLMEIYAGYIEHTDAQVGRLVDSLEERGVRDNTLIFYIWGDNGSSAEGQNGSISELLAQNQIPNTVEQQLEALEELGGLDALGTSATDSMYHAGWAWAGSTPFKHTKLVASHFGGTRNPLVVSWPAKIKPDATVRSQFHHVNDVAPTVYDVLAIPHPTSVNGVAQDPIDGVSMAATFADAKAPENKPAQYFSNNGSRGIYHDGWYACTFGPLIPWVNAQAGLEKWDANDDIWELYDLGKDFSQANDLAQDQPERLAQMQARFLTEAEDNQVFPIGAGIWLRLHPEDAKGSKYSSWTFDSTTVRMPEFIAPPIGKKSNKVTIEAEFGDDASGVLYAMGGSGGGLSCYMDKGYLCFEYNLMILYRSLAKSEQKITKGKHTIVVTTTLRQPKPGSPADIVLNVDGKEVARTSTKMTVPGLFSASESFDVGIDLGSAVARDYFERAPFRFDGTISTVKIGLQ
jgi:arylsulfatase